MTSRVVEIKLFSDNDPESNQRVFIPRIKIIPSEATVPFKLCQLQFPLRLAFSIIINKSQGQSLQNVGLDLRSPVFTHGQLYVAVSRATSVYRIHAIWSPDKEQPVTKNIVYTEVLL
jgi:hypothetical protein